MTSRGDKKQTPKSDIDRNTSTLKEERVPQTHLPDRHFQARNSLLTDLVEEKHINTIYNIFVVIFTLLLLNVFVSDFADTGKINNGLHTIIKGFRDLQDVIVIWLCIQLSTLAVFPVFYVWAKLSIWLPFTTIWNLIGVISVVAYQCAFITLATKAVIDFQLGTASSMALLIEVVRFMMKTHAFIRSSAPGARCCALNRKKSKSSDNDSNDDDSPVQNNKQQPLPTFAQFVYFLFAPTLVYRDEYPRTEHIRWRFVLKCFLEVLSMMFVLSFLFERIKRPTYLSFGSHFYEIGVKELITSVFISMLPGLLSFVCFFYCVLHAWMNAFAEMLRFADRMFYLDWWNATNFSVFFRTWNTIVHDWLYLYVYKDLYEHVFKRNRSVCQLFVFNISAIFHEYIFGFSFRFFYPVIFMEYQGTLLFFFMMRKDYKTFGNYLIMMSLAMSVGLFMSLYHMEYYARENCVYDKENIVNYLIPLSWSCNGIKFNKKLASAILI